MIETASWIVKALVEGDDDELIDLVSGLVTMLADRRRKLVAADRTRKRRRKPVAADK